MIGRILDFSVRSRWAVVLFTLVAAAVGAWALARLPIDAVPDITNNQVQINTLAPGLSPYEVDCRPRMPASAVSTGKVTCFSTS